MRSRVVPTRSLLVSSSRTLGLSTLELVVSLGMVLAVCAVAIPSIAKTMRIFQLNDAASQVAGIVKLTRLEAIRRNTPVDCVSSQSGANGPANLWSDSNGDGVEQPTEKQIVLSASATLVAEAVVPGAAALATAIGVATTTPVDPSNGRIKFDPRGAVNPPAVYVIYVGNLSASNGGFRAVVVMPSGAVQVWTYAGGASNVWQQLS
jgi:Tfp pilus assembly protein FimT